MISFLKDVLLPRQFRDYFLFSTSFLAVEQSEEKIYCLKMTAIGRKRSVTNVTEKEIPIVGLASDKQEIVSNLIIELFKEAGTHQELILILPDEGVIFKELTVPFVDIEKIKEILPFEVEPLIPFSKELARIEFIQTKVYDGKSDVFVAIAQQSFIDQHIVSFQASGVIPQRISVRAFLIWYMFHNSGILIPEGHLVIDFDKNHCSVLFFVQRQLRIIRVFSYGFQLLINQISQQTQQSKEEVFQALIQNIELLPESVRVQYALAIKKFKNDLFFTIQGFVAQYSSLTITALYREHNFQGLIQLLAAELHAENKLFSIEFVLQQFQIDGQNITTQFMPCLIAAFPVPEVMGVNFIRGSETKVLYNLYIRQFATTLIISFTILLFVFFTYRNNLNVLKDEIQMSEAEVVRVLKAEFDIPAEEKNIDDVIDAASREAANKEKTWLAFSNKARTSLLQYLLELTERIDKESLDFVLERITFDQSKIILKAEVKDYEALKNLERELRQSKLFTYVEPQDNPRFTMTINLLPLGEQE